MSTTTPPKIAVVGSLNVDLFYQVERFPLPGETITGLGTEIHFGGKGANQCLAARRAGADVEMIGCLGQDDHGRNYRSFLAQSGIGTDGITTIPSHPSGSALILTESSGQNVIVVEPGANGQLSPAMIKAQEDRIKTSDILLLQLECPLETVRIAATIAAENQTRIILNPSPWQDAVLKADIPFDDLILNETEAAYYFGQPNLSKVNHGGPSTIIITRGDQSTVCLKPDGSREEVPSFPVVPVDTVGAGDSFAGAYAVAVAERQPIKDALAFANAAGALATLKSGAQSAIPFRKFIHEFLSNPSNS